MRPASLGLRTKLVMALIATGAATFVALVAIVVPPLERRLADDRVRELAALSRTAELGISRLRMTDLRPGAPRLEAYVMELSRRIGGPVALLDTRGAIHADTDPVRSDRDRRVAKALATSRLPPPGGVRTELRRDQVVAVAVMETRAGRRVLVLQKSLDDSRAAAAVVRRVLPVGGLVALAVAIALGAALGYGLLRRLDRLSRVARRLADEGVQEPVPVDMGRDEVGDVARALELMRSRLYAQELGRQSFLASASHELRTPLASLQGTIELLQEELRAPAPDLEGARRRADAVRTQGLRLANLAESLLGLGRLDAEVPLAEEPTELSELAGTVAAEVEAAAQTAGVAVGLRVRARTWACVDPRAVARILRVLLENALRHGATNGGAICVVVHRRGERAILRVEDKGEGVPVADRERVFGRFERSDTSGQGFGLGLPIARGLARRMGGDVRLVPSPVGAWFEVDLPGCAAPKDPPRWQDARDARTADPARRG
jgi:signal transduction histidine kinase